jgi:hypothetical protein
VSGTPLVACEAAGVAAARGRAGAAVFGASGGAAAGFGACSALTARPMATSTAPAVVAVTRRVVMDA